MITRAAPSTKLSSWETKPGPPSPEMSQMHYQAMHFFLKITITAQRQITTLDQIEWWVFTGHIPQMVTLSLQF
jgi:hypothetical protein